MVRLRVIPIYGYGWNSADSGFVEVPPEFEMEASIVVPGKPFRVALGQASQSDHPLNSLWILLDRRTGGSDPTYNLYAFKAYPKTLDREVLLTSAVTGFAAASTI